MLSRSAAGLVRGSSHLLRSSSNPAFTSFAVLNSAWNRGIRPAVRPQAVFPSQTGSGWDFSRIQRSSTFMSGTPQSTHAQTDSTEGVSPELLKDQIGRARLYDYPESLQKSGRRVLLTKSKYMLGLQCPKQLWFHMNRPDLVPPTDPVTQHLFTQGHEVGDLAKKLYPFGIEVPFKPWNKVLTTTRDLIMKPPPRVPIFEATFQPYELMSRVDVMVPVANGAWDIVEVKSSTKTKSVHIDDVAFQYYCLNKGCHLKIRKCFVLTVDNSARREALKDLQPEDFFQIEDVTEAVLEQQPLMHSRISKMMEIIALPAPPMSAQRKQMKLTALDPDLPEQEDPQFNPYLARDHPELLEALRAMGLTAGNKKQLLLTEDQQNGLLESEDAGPTAEDQEEGGLLDELPLLRNNLRHGPPVVPIGSHCDSPYECTFKNVCWSHLPKTNGLHQLSRLGPAAKRELWWQGRTAMSHIPFRTTILPPPGFSPEDSETIQAPTIPSSQSGKASKPQAKKRRAKKSDRGVLWVPVTERQSVSLLHTMPGRTGEDDENTVVELSEIQQVEAWAARSGHLFCKLPELEAFLSSEYDQQDEAFSALNSSGAELEAAGTSSDSVNLRYPLYFLDFESINPCVPLLPGSKPYEQVPVQYSLHVQRSPPPLLRVLNFLRRGGRLSPAFMEALIKLGFLGRAGKSMPPSGVWDASGAAVQKETLSPEQINSLMPDSTEALEESLAPLSQPGGGVLGIEDESAARLAEFQGVLAPEELSCLKKLLLTPPVEHYEFLAPSDPKHWGFPAPGVEEESKTDSPALPMLPPMEEDSRYQLLQSLKQHLGLLGGGDGTSGVADGAFVNNPRFMGGGQQLQPFVGTLVAYNQAFEKTMLKHLANHFPEEGQLWLNGFLGGKGSTVNWVDLYDLFRHRHVYHPAQSGGASLKAALPAMLSLPLRDQGGDYRVEDGEVSAASNGLDYSELAIADGSSANVEFFRMIRQDAINQGCAAPSGDEQVSMDLRQWSEEKHMLREALRRYCELDTKALVLLLNKLAFWTSRHSLIRTEEP